MQNPTVNPNPAPAPVTPQDSGSGSTPSTPGASQPSSSTSGTGQSGSGQPGSAQTNKPGFGRVLGNVLGGAINVMAPAAGSILGTLMRGGGLGFAADMERMIAESAHQQMQMISVQMRVQDQTEQFTTVSNLLKSRHDGEMQAIQNFRS